MSDSPTPDTVSSHHGAAGESVIKAGYDERLTNQDLAPLKEQKWTWYNIFAFWMSDVHSVGGYVFAGSLFALGIAAWQVLVALVVGIVAVNILCNLVAKPSQIAGVPYPVTTRISFGVKGANIPAIIRGSIAVVWYGIQTYLASVALGLLALKFWPGLAPWGDVEEHGFLGLSALGWAGFTLMWVLQAFVFWNGMETIRKFIDFCGPAVYVVMLALAAYLVAKAGWGNVSLDLSVGEGLSGWSSITMMISAFALVVSYFSGPMLNFGDFSRYGKTFGEVKKGNFWGLPVNFLFFSLLVVCTVSAAVTVIGTDDDGNIITDPVHIVDKIDNTTAAVLGVLTFATATIGINIVANFVSPAFDFSNVAPTKISWRTGGMIAAVGSVLITPWNLFNNPTAIHYTMDTLGAVIGPLFGILIADFYLVKKQKIVVDDLFTMRPEGAYWYRNGWNPVAVGATVVASIAPICVVIFGTAYQASFTWFIGAALGAAVYWIGMKVVPTQLIHDASVEARITTDIEVDAAGEIVVDVPDAEPTVTSTGKDGEQLMRLCVINPNTSGEMTAVISRAARSVARPDTEITAVTSPTGPASIESHYDEALAVPGVLQAISDDPGAHGYLLACFGDPGLDAAREVAGAPVLGIAEAAFHLAAPLGRGFSIVTTLGRTVGRADDLVRHYGFTRQCLGIHACEIPVLELESNPHTAEILTKTCREALLADGSDVIVLGCAGMADLARTIGDRIGAPVIDGVAAGVGMLSALAAMGARTSTASGEFAAPRPKPYIGLLRGFGT